MESTRRRISIKIVRKPDLSIELSVLLYAISIIRKQTVFTQFRNALISENDECDDGIHIKKKNTAFASSIYICIYILQRRAHVKNNNETRWFAARRVSNLSEVSPVHD